MEQGVEALKRRAANLVRGYFRFAAGFFGFALALGLALLLPARLAAAGLDPAPLDAFGLLALVDLPRAALEPFFAAFGRIFFSAFSTVTTGGFPVCAPNTACRSSAGRL